MTVDDKFQRYLQFGGMPILGQFQFNEARSFEALEGIYNTVVLRDVLEKNKQSDHALLHKLVLFLCGNIGSITSPNNIGNVLSDEGDIQRVKRKAGTPIATAAPKQISWRFVKLKAILVLTLDKSFGTFT